MRSLDELIVDSSWPEIEEFVRSAPYPVEVLDADPERARGCLHEAQVTTRSWLGAVILHTGGILIDHGWLRVLGSGHAGRRLADLTTANSVDPIGILVAVDVLGGQFSWAQAVEGVAPTIHYFGPDTLEWQDLGVGYQDWLYSALTGSLVPFYESLRWPGWADEVQACPLDQGIHSWPPPSTVEGRDLGATSRKVIPMSELTAYHAGTSWQLG